MYTYSEYDVIRVIVKGINDMYSARNTYSEYDVIRVIVKGINDKFLITFLSKSRSKYIRWCKIILDFSDSRFLLLNYNSGIF
jgi:hypothetical protein